MWEMVLSFSFTVITRNSYASEIFAFINSYYGKYFTGPAVLDMIGTRMYIGVGR